MVARVAGEIQVAEESRKRTSQRESRFLASGGRKRHYGLAMAPGLFDESAENSAGERAYKSMLASPFLPTMQESGSSRSHAGPRAPPGRHGCWELGVHVRRWGRSNRSAVDPPSIDSFLS